MPKLPVIESAALSLPHSYPEDLEPDLEPAIQAELAALAEIERHHEVLCARLNGWTGPQAIRERLLRGLEQDRREQRQPHVLRLGDLHQRMVSATMFQDRRAVH